MGKHSVRVAADELNYEQLSVVIMRAASEMNWRLKEANSSAFVFFSADRKQRVIIQRFGQEIDINSESVGLGLKNSRKNSENENRFAEIFTSLKSFYTPEQLSEIFETEQKQHADYTQDLQVRMMNDELTPMEKMQLGVGGTLVTYILLALNILVFVFMALSGVSIIDPTGDQIITWGGNYRMYTLNGEWWRLITCVFVHIGILHLLMNMYALYVIGKQLEPLMGRFQFAVVYLTTGLFASLTSLWWSGARISAGASGAIFGMYGVFLALLTTNLIEKETRKQLLSSIGIFVGYNLLFGLKAGIDNAAHIGGLVSGLVFGYLFYYFSVQQKKAPSVLTVVALVGVMLTGYIVFNSLNSEDDKFEANLLQFAEYENTAIEPLKNYDNLKFGELEEQLRKKTLPAWEKAKGLIVASQAYKVSTEYAQRRTLLAQYIDLRIKQTNLFIAAEAEETHKYDAEILKTNNEVIAIIERLQNKKEQP